jgi:hypothetical protein
MCAQTPKKYRPLLSSFKERAGGEVTELYATIGVEEKMNQIHAPLNSVPI